MHLQVPSRHFKNHFTPVRNQRTPMIRHHFAVILLLRFCSPSVSFTAATDTTALAGLKSAVNPSSIPPFSCLASWNFSSPPDPCRTFLCGISCSADGRVTAVVLDAAGYSGELPAVISNLTQLHTLDLSNNFFYGKVPDSIALLSNLRSISFTSNSFAGQIPFSSLANLSSLENLDLSGNSFSGVIPASLSSFSAISNLDLSHNRLAGALPSSLPPNLITLAVRGNLLTGIVNKSVFEKLASLEVMDLSRNRFRGKIEGWIFRLPKIQQVNLANNSFESWEVLAAGGRGEELVAVDLGFNRIEGELPAKLSGYPALVAVTVSHNRLRGMIPWEYHGKKKGASFRRLFLDGNYLYGRVPVELMEGEMTGSFGDNCLEGCPLDKAICSPRQKPGWICKSVYSGDGRRR